MESKKCDPDDFMNSFLSISKDPMRDTMEYQCSRSTDSFLAFNGLSEVNMQEMQADIPICVSSITAGMRTEAMFDYSEVKQNCSSSIELSGLPCLYPYETVGNKRPDTSVLSYHRSPKEETFSMEPHMLTDWQQAESHAFPANLVKTEQANQLNYNLESRAATSVLFLNNMYSKRSKSAESEQNRRTLIAKRMHALGDLLPSSSKVKQNDQECIVDNVIAYVKYLQLQLKELSRSRLGGDSVSAPLNFVEGYGHYHPHEKILKEPLEEVFGSLLEENPERAISVLKLKGFHMMPPSCIDDGLPNAE